MQLLTWMLARMLARALTAQPPAYTDVMGGTYALATFLGPLLGGIFTKRPSWRWLFYINIPIEGCRRPLLFYVQKLLQQLVKYQRHGRIYYYR